MTAPCENCITLPICKSIKGPASYIISPILLEKCSLIREYSGLEKGISYDRINENLYAIREVLNK